MAGRPLVSVLIPAHDAAADLPCALASVCAQTLGAIEAVVVDDASSDDTIAVVEAWRARDPRIRLVRTERNLGPAGARNLGLEAARGEWIALLDSDDALEPGRLARLLEVAEAAGADMIADNLRLLEPGCPDGTAMIPPELLSAPRRIDGADFLIGNLPDRAHPRVSFGFLKPVFRRSFLCERGLWYDQRLRFAEDFDFYLRCLTAGARFWLIPEAGYRYTVRPGSLTATHGADDLLRLRGVDRRLLRRAEVAADDRLRLALCRHLRSIERRLLWRWFTDALKQGDWRRARLTAATSPYRAALVAAELVHALPRITGKRLRRLAPALPVQT